MLAGGCKKLRDDRLRALHGWLDKVKSEEMAGFWLFPTLLQAVTLISATQTGCR
jgi:hypothetical protein